MGKYLIENAQKPDSLVQTAYENDVPILCPAFSDSSAGFGLVKHQIESQDNHICIDSIKDFRELTEIKTKSPVSGLFIVGGGVPKNFAQDTVVCAEQWFVPKFSANRWKCTNMRFRLQLLMSEMAHVQVPPSRKPAPGVRSTQGMSKWFMPKLQAFYL